MIDHGPPNAAQVSEFSEVLIVVASAEVAERVVRNSFAQEDDVPIGEQKVSAPWMVA